MEVGFEGGFAQIDFMKVAEVGRELVTVSIPQKER